MKVLVLTKDILLKADHRKRCYYMKLIVLGRMIYKRA